MRHTTFWFTYVLLLVVQLLLNRFLRVSPYVAVYILPMMVLCISIRVQTWAVMLIAFATGVAADLLSEGVVGLNAVALVPVALLRNIIVQAVFGTEVFARQEDFSSRRNGWGKVSLAATLALLLYLIMYIWVDAAGMRPFGYNLLRLVCSLAVSLPANLIALELLAPDSRR